MATSALQSLTFGVVDSKKSERGYAGIGLLALLGLGAWKFRGKLGRSG